MRVLHTVAGLWEGTGGPTASVTSLCGGLAARGHHVTLLTGTGPLHPAVVALSSRIRVRTEPLGPYLAAHWSRAFRDACLEEARGADIVHDHGVWLHTNWSSVRMARRAGRPVVRSPRGMLSPWALRHSRIAKTLLWHLAERRLFDQAAFVHVTSDLEEGEVQRLGVRAPTIVIPNGVDLRHEYAASKVAQARRNGIPEAAGRRVVLFLSRLHPKKGLDLLCRVWEGLPKDAPILLLVAGPGDIGSVRALRQWLGTQQGPAALYAGAVGADRKIALLSSAWIMALPSYSENYAMVVAEALACGTPVLTTAEMPWNEVAAAGCGWVIRSEAGALKQALNEALNVSPDEHDRMRCRARALVDRTHSLDAAVARMEESYTGVLDRYGIGRGTA